MGVSNFEKEDLVGDRLRVLLDGIKELGGKQDFKGIKDFLVKFGEEMRLIPFFAETTGKRTIDLDVTDTDTNTGATTHYDIAEINSAVKTIVAVVLEALDDRKLTDAKRDEFEEAYAAFKDFLDPIFQQGRMMEELMNRGFDVDEFEAAQEEANEESKRKQKEYTSRISSHKKLEKEILGDEYKVSENPPKYGAKNLQTQINFRKTITKKIEIIIAELAEIKLCKENMAKNDAHPTMPDAEKAMRNERQQNDINQHAMNIHGAIGDIEEMDMGVNLVQGLQELKTALKADPQSGNYTIETTNIDKFINTTGPVLIADNETELEAAYKELNNRAQSKAAELKAEGLMTDAELDALKGEDPTTHHTTEDARKAMDEFMLKLAEREKQLKQQAIYHGSSVKLREAGMKRFRELRSKSSDYLARTHSETVEVENPDGTKTQKEVRVPNDDLKSELLANAGFDRASKEAELRQSKLDELRSKYPTFSYSDKRKELKKRGIGNWFTRLFPSALTTSLRLGAEEEDKVRKDAATAEEAALDAAYKTYDGEGRAAAAEIGKINEKYGRAKASAPVQTQIQYGAFDVSLKHRDDISEKEPLMDSMQSFAYEDALIRQAIEWGLGKERQRKAVRRSYNPEQVVIDHAKSEGVEQDQSYAGVTPRHEDREEEPDL